MFQQLSDKTNPELLESFKKAHPKIVELNAEIEVRHIVQDDNGKQDYYEIHIGYPFVFDQKILPNEFNGVTVTSGCKYDSLPFMFRNEFDYDLLTPKNYEKFVSQNIDEIRKILKYPDLSNEEALDALTSDFEKFKKFYKGLHRDNGKKPKDLFFELLEEIKELYKESTLFNNNWKYSLSSTELVKHKPLIVGLNWGARKGVEYKEQKEYPEGLFGDIKSEDLGTLNNLKQYFKDYCPDCLNGVQTNFCFFRSENEKQVTQKDLGLCVYPFERLVSYLEPTKIIVLSSKVHYFIKELKILDKIELKVIPFNRGSRALSLYTCKGELNFCNMLLDYYYLPHPQCRITDDARKEAWKFCFKKND